MLVAQTDCGAFLICKNKPNVKYLEVPKCDDPLCFINEQLMADGYTTKNQDLVIWDKHNQLRPYNREIIDASDKTLRADWYFGYKDIMETEGIE
jgi:hypothetical protein